MTALPDPPIPADLAVDEPPFTDADLERYEAAVLAFADDLTIDTSEAAVSYLDDDATSETPVTRWRIDDDGAAEWAMRHLAAISAERGELVDRAADWEDRIRQWFTKSIRPLDARRAFFEHRLIDYARRRREETQKATLSLPSGKVSSRRNPPAAVVADEAAVIAWARANLDGDQQAAVVKVVESVLVSGLREFVSVAGDKVVAEGGEVVPGAVVRPETIGFSVAPS